MDKRIHDRFNFWVSQYAKNLQLTKTNSAINVPREMMTMFKHNKFTTYKRKNRDEVNTQKLRFIKQIRGERFYQGLGYIRWIIQI